MANTLKKEYLENLKKQNAISQLNEKKRTCTKKDLNRLDIQKIINDNHQTLTKTGKIEIKIKDLSKYVNDGKPWNKYEADPMLIKKYMPQYGILLNLEDPEWYDHYLTIKIPRIHPYISRTLCIIAILIMLGIIAHLILTGQTLTGKELQ
jgi:hypothetical protein